MRFAIRGTDQETGVAIDLAIEATDVSAAAAIATKKGIRVSSVAEFDGNREPESARLARASSTPGSGKPRRGQTGMSWVTVALVVAVVPAIFAPALTFWTGVSTSGLVLTYMLLPPLRARIGRVLHLPHQRPVLRGFKLGTFFIAGLLLIVVSYVGFTWEAERSLAAAKHRELESAAAQSRATAAATLTAIVARARDALAGGDIARAESLIDDAMHVVNAPNRSEAVLLKNKIRESASPESVLARLVEATDEEFERFQAARAMPSTLDFGYAELNRRALVIANEQVEFARRERERSKAQTVLALEEAEKSAQLASEAEQQMRSARRDELTRKCDAFMGVVKSSGTSLITSVEVTRRGNLWEAELSVSNLWHSRHYQVRLQDAQALWAAWAQIASPNDLDLARIKLVDGNGNEVGGSRFLAGSLIWVQDR